MEISKIQPQIASLLRMNILDPLNALQRNTACHHSVMMQYSTVLPDDHNTHNQISIGDFTQRALILGNDILSAQKK